MRIKTKCCQRKNRQTFAVIKVLTTNVYKWANASIINNAIQKKNRESNSIKAEASGIENTVLNSLSNPY